MINREYTLFEEQQKESGIDLEKVRQEMGAAVVPMKAYQDSGYAQQIPSRGKGGASW